MKRRTNKTRLWYLGYAGCALILLLIAFAGFPKEVDVGLAMVMGALFGLSHVELWYERQVRKDENFEIEVGDERNVQIKYRAGYMVCGVDMTLFGIATAVFVMLDYTVPAVITGVMLVLQPVLLIAASAVLEKRM